MYMMSHRQVCSSAPTGCAYGSMITSYRDLGPTCHSKPVMEFESLTVRLAFQFNSNDLRIPSCLSNEWIRLPKGDSGMYFATLRTEYIRLTNPRMERRYTSLKSQYTRWYPNLRRKSCIFVPCRSERNPT